MYTLTLSKEDRNAIDWVDYRYTHGSELRSVLTSCEATAEWDDDGDVTFTMPEYKAWEARELITDLECFGAKLCQKLRSFSDSIV